MLLLFSSWLSKANPNDYKRIKTQLTAEFGSRGARKQDNQTAIATLEKSSRKKLLTCWLRLWLVDLVLVGWWTYFRKESKQCFSTIAWQRYFHKTFISCCLLSVFIVYSQLDWSSWEEETATKINSMNILVALVNFRKPRIWFRNSKFIIVWY